MFMAHISTPFLYLTYKIYFLVLKRRENTRFASIQRGQKIGKTEKKLS